MWRAQPHELAEHILLSSHVHVVCNLRQSGWFGLKKRTLTSKNARSHLPPQKPLAATSSRALSSVLALRVEKDSPLSGWRWGSSWQTSVSKLVKRSHTSLCQIIPPVGQERACSMVNKEPQVHRVGSCEGDQL